MRSTLLRFFALLALLLMGYYASHAQSEPQTLKRTVTGLGDPEPMDPRYAAAAEVAELKSQIHTLTQAYGELVMKHNEQTTRLRELEQKQQTPVTTGRGPAKALRTNPLSGSY